MIKTPLLLVLSAALFSLPPKHLRAYAVAANGANTIVNPETAHYVPCDVDIQYRGMEFLVDHRHYPIHYTEGMFDEKAYFGYHLHGRDTVSFSIAVLPMKELGEWYVLISWQDSTKAYKTKTIE